MRRLIIDESPLNPKYFEHMSELLNAIIEARGQDAIAYAAYLEKMVELARQCLSPGEGKTYPASLESALGRTLYDNLGEDETLALAVAAVPAAK